MVGKKKEIPKSVKCFRRLSLTNFILLQETFHHRNTIADESNYDENNPDKLFTTNVYANIQAVNKNLLKTSNKYTIKM